MGVLAMVLLFGEGRVGRAYVSALLLVEPGRAASDGLETPAGHHGGREGVYTYISTYISVESNNCLSPSSNRGSLFPAAWG